MPIRKALANPYFHLGRAAYEAVEFLPSGNHKVGECVLVLYCIPLRRLLEKEADSGDVIPLSAVAASVDEKVELPSSLQSVASPQTPS